MSVIPVYISFIASEFDDERATLVGPVHQALSALVAPYGGSVEYLDSPRDDAVLIRLVSGELAPSKIGVDPWIYFVRDRPGVNSVEARLSAVKRFALQEAYFYEFPSEEDGSPIADPPEFETLAIDALSVPVVDRAWATSQHPRQPVSSPAATLELAITLQRIGELAQDRGDLEKAESAYEEASDVLGELAPEDGRAQPEIRHVDYLRDALAERKYQSRDARAGNQEGPLFLREGPGAGARVKSRTPNDRRSRSRWWIEQPTDGPVRYTVWFGTNRMPRNIADVSLGFRDGVDSDMLSLGQCEVHVPKAHRFGSVGKRWWRSWLRLGNSGEPLRLGKIEPALSAEHFISSLHDVLRASDAANRILVYLHGFNTSFEEAAIRAAQIGYDLKYTGAMAFFSWPSHAVLAPDAYAGDAQRAEASEARFLEYLTLLSSSQEDVSIDVLVHSLGNQPFIRSVRRMVGDAVNRHMRLGTVILAAPDVDVAIFRESAPLYEAVATKTTMYVSASDRPLWISGRYQRSDRAGYAPPVTIVDGIDTIEVSSIDFSAFGHGYFGSSHAVLHDMHALLRGVQDPAYRPRLTTVRDVAGREFWRFSS